MALVMPKTLIIDTNFFVSFHNTHNSAALKNISDLIRNSEFTILVPRGVLEETNYKTNQKLKLIVESAFRIEEIDYENALYKEIRKKAIDRNCFTSNERVDPEVLYLAYLQSQNGRVGIVTFDMGFKIALEVVPLVKQRKIELISPWIFLFEIYKLSDFSLRQKLRKVILDIYYYFYEFRLKEGQRAIENSAAARGGILSGKTLKNLTKYGQDFAQTDFNQQQAIADARRRDYLNEYYGQMQVADQRRKDAINEWLISQQPWQAMAGMGQGAANQLASSGVNYSNMFGTLNNRYAGNVGSNYGQNVGNIGLRSATNQTSALANMADAATNRYQNYYNLAMGLGKNIYGGY